MGGGMGSGGYVSGGAMGGGMGGMGGSMGGGGSFGGSMMMGGGMMGGMGAYMTEDYSDDTGSASATVLTIRAKKSDVDDFAKGEIDFKQFQEKVDIFTY